MTLNAPFPCCIGMATPACCATATACSDQPSEHGLAPLIRLLDTNESLQDMAAARPPFDRAAPLALLLLAAV